MENLLVYAVFVSSCFMLFWDLPRVANIYSHGITGWLLNIPKPSCWLLPTAIYKEVLILWNIDSGYLKFVSMSKSC